MSEEVTQEGPKETMVPLRLLKAAEKEQGNLKKQLETAQGELEQANTKLGEAQTEVENMKTTIRDDRRIVAIKEAAREKGFADADDALTFIKVTELEGKDEEEAIANGIAELDALSEKKPYLLGETVEEEVEEEAPAPGRVTAGADDDATRVTQTAEKARKEWGQSILARIGG